MTSPFRPTLAVSTFCALLAPLPLLAPVALAQTGTSTTDTAVKPVSPPAGQNDLAQTFSPIIVTATRTPQTLSHTIGDDSVIDSEILQKTPSATLGDVLGRERSIGIVEYGGPQTLTTINVRGTNSRQSLVMIDGMRVNSPTNGLPVLNAIPLNAIERIEIVRGAASSLYGANAMGGVINVITRQPADRPLSGYINMGVGSYGTTEYDAGLSGSQDMWSYSLYGGYGQSGGYQATNGDYPFANNADKDSYYRSNIGGQIGLTWAPDQTISVQTLQSRVNGGYDSFDPVYNDRGIQTLGNTIITSRNRINDRWLSTLSGSFLDEKNETRTDPKSGPPGYFQSSQAQYLWLNTLDIAADQTLNVGLERLEQSVNGSDAGRPVQFAQDSIHTNSVMANYTGKWGAHRIQASLRNDDNSQYGNFTTGSLAYAYEFARGWQASVAMNNAFRAPTFSELYYPGFSNPDLAPEKSRNYEIGLRYTHQSGKLSLVGYHNRITDLIASEAPTYIPQNIQNATIKGMTFSFEQWVGSQTQVYGSFDLLSPYNNSTGKRLPFIAQRTLRLGAEHRINDLTLDADWMLTSDRSDGTAVLGGYGLLNLGVQYAVSPQVSVQLRWNNVLGKDYTLVRGYNTPGSNVFFNVRLEM